MDYHLFHTWPTTKHDAHEIQKQMAARLDVTGNLRPPKTVAAVETAYGFEGKVIYATSVVMTFPELKQIERQSSHIPVRFPYVPGLFYFREGPAIIKSQAKVEHTPDVIIVHGHGTAHPRQCGMASSIGLVFGTPTIGCARKLLYGRHREVAVARGSSEPIRLDSRTIGLAYRSRDSVKPIFISPGHQCNLEQARDIVVQGLRGYRLPEASRIAHAAVNAYRRKQEQKEQSVTG